jgi:glycosyltransferase involved in cell wall biosynthesis
MNFRGVRWNAGLWIPYNESPLPDAALELSARQLTWAKGAPTGVTQRNYTRITDMDISVVLGTYNRAASLRITLESFSKLICPPNLSWELLVVDNNSTDSTREEIEKFAGTASFPVRYIFEQQQGRSAALNAGIAAANGEIISFTDDDVYLHPDWLSNLKRGFDQFDCAAVAGRVVPQWSHPKPDWLEMEGQFAVVNFDLGDDVKEIRIPPLGANCAFRKDIFKKYGVFRLDLGVNGSRHTVTCDDTEFGERLIRGGEKIAYCPDAIIYHPVDPYRTTKKYFLSWYYYNGVSLTRTAGLPNEGIFWVGAPRWLYRELLTNFAKWMLTLPGERRFHRKLRTYRSVGNIVESYRLSKVKSAKQVDQEPQRS